MDSDNRNTFAIKTFLKDYLDSFDIIFTLENEKDRVKVNLVKDHDRLSLKKLNLELDPQTLLLARA